MKKKKKIEKLQKTHLSNSMIFQTAQSNLFYTKYILSKEEGIALSYGHKNPVPHQLN